MFENAADVEEYSVIGARSSTEVLSPSGLYKSLTDFKIYTMFDREPVQHSIEQ